jgi:hypothetical protein
VCRFYNTVKRRREGGNEKDSIYIQRIMRKTLMLRHSKLLATGYITLHVTNVHEPETCYRSNTRSLKQGLMPPVYISSLSPSLFSVP